MQTNVNRERNLIWKQLENNIQVTQFTSTSNGGSKVYIKKFNALKNDPQKKVTIFLLHDICQYHGRFLSFIDWTRENHPGISFVAMDFVGHGLSSGTRGHIDDFEDLVNDSLVLLQEVLKKEDENEKWLILGQGLGGLVALDLINRHQDLVEKKIDGLIISNFILRYRSFVLGFENNLTRLSIGVKTLMSHSRFVKVLKGAEMLSDPQDILLYEQDPLVIHRPTFVTIKEIQNKVANIYQDSYFIGRPVLLLKSERDNATNSSGIEYFARGIKKELLTEKKYSLLKHDLYNETDNEVVFQDIMNWMKSYES
jgi:lysophospholipase